MNLIHKQVFIPIMFIITNKYRSTYYIGMTNNLKERLNQHKENLELGNKTFAGNII